MFVFTFLLVLAAAEAVTPETNDRPIIGILSQELSPTVSNIFGQHSSYIAASYVKFVEGAGGRVVPIWINQTEDYYREIIGRVNGLLFPGGATYFGSSDGYSAAGKILYDLAVDMNNQGDYFPIFGTCLGFELLLYIAAGEKELRCDCVAQNITLPLQFKDDYNESRMFSDISKNVMQILMSENVTANFHSLCITQKNLTEFGLSKQWHTLSVNTDVNGLEFISTIESWIYPFYGVIFHPEKNGYEWKLTKNIPHTTSSILTMQYFADFFVNEARKNFHSFSSEKAEEAALIYKYSPTYTGNRLIYEQCYFFEN